MARLDPVRLIERKRDGGELTAEEIEAFIAGLLDGGVSDAQASALFMAGLLRGFTEAEAVALTSAYVESGDVVDLASLRGPTVDKHSTGGVADSTTFVVGPVVAACGVQLAKLSGRGLGHTGGTLDKLEAIPGLRVDLTPDQVANQVDRIGLAVAAATADIAPADKHTYALRDVTGTVASPALIAASIMSKKIAGGAASIVLDVKTGDGAFLKEQQEAGDLAALCIRIGRARGRNVGALLTDMSQPLGPAIGNALEVRAAIDVLTGTQNALAEVSLALAGRVLDLAGIADGPERAAAAVADGSAAERLEAMIAAQGGDGRVVQDPSGVLPRAPVVRSVTVDRSGAIAGVRCADLGVAAVHLGAGRLQLGDPVDPAVGIVVHRRIGDQVEAGDTIAEVHARSDADAESAVAQVRAAYEIADAAAAIAPVLHDVEA